MNQNGGLSLQKWWKSLWGDIFKNNHQYIQFGAIKYLPLSDDVTFVRLCVILGGVWAWPASNKMLKA